MTDQPFGFKVKTPGSSEMPGYTYTWGWEVRLPHQCSTWDIVGGEAWVETSDHAVAIAEFERFIAEAQQALTALREGRAFDAEAQS